MHTQIPTTGTAHETASWIWRNLVPKSGQAETVQGELLRAVEKLRWEAQENGNINWDEGFEKLIAYLRSTLTPEPWLKDNERTQLASDLQRLSTFSVPSDEEDFQDDSLPYVEDDLYDRLVELVVLHAKAHPELLPRAIDPTLLR